MIDLLTGWPIVAAAILLLLVPSIVARLWWWAGMLTVFLIVFLLTEILAYVVIGATISNQFGSYYASHRTEALVSLGAVSTGYALLLAHLVAEGVQEMKRRDEE